MSLLFSPAFQDAFFDELEKIGACRENRNKRDNHTKTRSGRIPIKPGKLAEQGAKKEATIAGAAKAGTEMTLGQLAAMLGKNKFVWGLGAGIPAGAVGLQGAKDLQMGRQYRKAMSQRQG